MGGRGCIADVWQQYLPGPAVPCARDATARTFLSYRNLDVSTLKILASLWAPDVAKGFSKDSEHLALADIRDSIEELSWYREHLIDADAISGK